MPTPEEILRKTLQDKCMPSGTYLYSSTARWAKNLLDGGADIRKEAAKVLSQNRFPNHESIVHSEREWLSDLAHANNEPTGDTPSSSISETSRRELELMQNITIATVVTPPDSLRVHINALKARAYDLGYQQATEDAQSATCDKPIQEPSLLSPIEIEERKLYRWVYDSAFGDGEDSESCGRAGSRAVKEQRKLFRI